MSTASPTDPTALAPLAVLVDADADRRIDMKRWLVGRGVEVIDTDNPFLAVARARAVAPEIVLVDAGTRESAGPAVAVAVKKDDATTEVIIYEHAACAPEAEAARALGLSCVRPYATLKMYLGVRLSDTVHLVRLRRAERAAQKRLDEMPDPGSLRPEGDRLALPTAEARYRAAALRAALRATDGNRKQAALYLNIPYTSLCQMMRVLGIRA